MRDTSTFWQSIKLTFLLCIICTLLCACANQNPPSNNPKQKLTMYNTKNIKIFANEEGLHQKIVDTIKIAKFNKVGIKRQQAIMDDLLKRRTAKHGGTAVVILHDDDREIIGGVVK